MDISNKYKEEGRKYYNKLKNQSSSDSVKPSSSEVCWGLYLIIKSKFYWNVKGPL